MMFGLERKTKMIMQYVKANVKGQKRKVGVLVGQLNDKGQIVMGWSKANASLGDKFDKKYGINLAVNRTCSEQILPYPVSFRKEASKFEDRCLRYFKNGERYK